MTKPSRTISNQAKYVKRKNGCCNILCWPTDRQSWISFLFFYEECLVPYYLLTYSTLLLHSSSQISPCLLAFWILSIRCLIPCFSAQNLLSFCRATTTGLLPPPSVWMDNGLFIQLPSLCPNYDVN